MSSFGIKVVVIEPGAIRTEWAAISADNLEATSADTAYRDQAKIVSGALRAADKSRTASEPAVVANVWVPRTRPTSSCHEPVLVNEAAELVGPS